VVAQKYQTEFTFNTYPTQVALFRPSDIYGLGNSDLAKLSEFHIYFVCRRPKVTLLSETIRTNSKYIFLDTELHRLGAKNQICFKYERNGNTFPQKFSKIKASPYPHDLIIIENDAGEEAAQPVSFVIQGSVDQFSELGVSEISNMEVIYIGQSYSLNDNRTILDRLTKHETIQKILARQPIDNPDSELFLFLFKYDPAQYIIKIDGKEEPLVNDEVDSNHIKEVSEHIFTEAQQTSITEAALIRYFQPEFNKIYKESFPSTNLKILQSCYTLDLCSIAASLAATDFGVNFWSASIKTSAHHIAVFDLHSPDDRKGFFAL
jgi:hypothetical protein